MIEISPLAKKIRPLALNCATLERFKVKRHTFDENLYIAESPKMALTESISEVEPYFFF